MVLVGPALVEGFLLFHLTTTQAWVLGLLIRTRLARVLISDSGGTILVDLLVIWGLLVRDVKVAKMMTGLA